MPIAKSHKNTGGFIGTTGTYLSGGVFSNRMETALAYTDRWDVVRNGLLLHLDAKDARSYSGSGTTWADLSGTGSTAAWEATPTWNGSYFSNTNNISASFTLSSTPSNVTSVEMTMKINTIAGMPFGWQNYDVYSQGGPLGYNTGAGDTYGLTTAQVTALGLTSAVKHYVFEMRSDLPVVNNKIYVNGTLQSLSQVASSEAPANRNFNSGVGRISCWKADNNYRMDMNLYQFKIYNRVLSQDEINYNYSIAKMKFGF